MYMPIGRYLITGCALRYFTSEVPAAGPPWLIYLIMSGYLFPQAAIWWRMGSKSLPFCVSVYSMRGGTSAKLCRLIMPLSSRSSSLLERVRGLIFPTDFSRIQKRFGPAARSRKISAVHLFPTIPMAAAMQPTRGSRRLESLLKSIEVLMLYKV
jgi:hypothetical protein